MSNKNKKTVAQVAKEVEGLENAPVNEVGASVNVNYSDREWLEKNAPEFLPEFISKKYDAEREPKVQEGLVAIKSLVGDKINPLVLLLGKWWEVKPARAEIKKMIDAEAASKNIPDDRYLQIDLRTNVDALASISQATDRLKYAITYFKPREGVGVKDVFKVMRINGVEYNVSLNALEKAKIEFAGDNEALKAHMASISTLVEVENL